eukprot:Nitzschia sp. Nitz4//scaffold105_size73764//63186//64085//NITZ4_005685-RA/size73764-processed-gene-0.11-mRNA-1//1//CDS//3329532474//559//frame0
MQRESTNNKDELLELIRSMNDQAARTVATGESYHRATQMFSKALALVRLAMKEEKEMLETEHGRQEATPKDSAITAQKLADLRQEYFQGQQRRGAQERCLGSAGGSATMNLNIEPAVTAGEPAEGDFVFCHLILSHQQVITQDSNDLETLSFTLMYNMAICHHLNSISALSSENNSRRQQDGNQPGAATCMAALRLYELAHQIQVVSDGVHVPLVYQCAILNNLADLHSKMGNQTASQQCHSHLLSALMYYVAAARGYSEERGVPPSTELMEMSLPKFFGTVSRMIACSDSATTTAEAA